MNDWLDIYAGLGYGRHQVLWQDIDGNWATVGQGLKGVCAEAGVLTSWKHFTFGAGISTISFRSLTPTLSVGINFEVFFEEKVLKRHPKRSIIRELFSNFD